MVKKNNQNRICFKMIDVAPVLVTIILVIATGWEIINYVRFEQGLTETGSHEYSDTISDDEILILERSQEQLLTTQRSEIHGSIVTLLCATLLSLALDAAFLSLRDKKA